MSTSRHHLYWPKRNYKTPLQKQFRNHPHNIVTMTQEKHRKLHMTEPPPDMLSEHEMREFLNKHPTNCKCNYNALVLV